MVDDGAGVPEASERVVAKSDSCHQAQVQVRTTVPPAPWWRERRSCKHQVATREMQKWRVPLLTYYHSACLDAFISCLDSWLESIHQMLELPPASCRRKLLWSARMQNWTVPLFRKCCSIGVCGNFTTTCFDALMSCLKSGAGWPGHLSGTYELRSMQGLC